MTQLPYSIAPSDMAFHALTTSLYKDRLRAPVREILSNAIDIQRRVGNERAIEVKLPTPLDAQFRIRDFGSGLSHANMLGLYSSLFSSDKHLVRANEVGGFGVGAKSPFAYTDTFTVESYHDGMHTVYSAFMDGNRAPQLVELFKAPTSEPNGLAVSYPIAKADEKALVEMVRQEIAICGHPVECVGVAEPVVPLESNPKFSRVGNAWLGNDHSVLPQVGRSTQGGRNDYQEGFSNGIKNTYARMGNVLYPLNSNPAYPSDLLAAMRVLESVSRGEKETGWRRRRPMQRQESNKGWTIAILDVPIGSIRPAMSREELVANDPLTVQGLRQAYANALKGLYRQSIDNNDLARCQQLFDESAYFRGTKLPSNDSASQVPSFAAMLEPEYTALSQMVKEAKNKDTLWQDTSLVVAPHAMMMLQRMRPSHMTMGGNTNALSDEFMIPRYMGPDLALESLEPLNQSHYKHQNIWSSSHAKLLLVSHQYGSAPWASSLLKMVQQGGRSRYRLEDNSSGKTTELANTNRLLQACAKASSRDSHYEMDDCIVLFATSVEHEQQLLDLASAYGRSMERLDLTTNTVTTVEPKNAPAVVATSAEATPLTADANHPYPPPPLDIATPVVAYYWDTRTNAIVETVLADLPTYWTVSLDSAPADAPVHALIENWQKHDTTGEIFYIVAPNHPSIGSDVLSPAWAQYAQSFVPEHAMPKTQLDWLLATCALPTDHPLHKSDQQRYFQEFVLLSKLHQYLSPKYGALQRASAYPKHPLHPEANRLGQTLDYNCLHRTFDYTAQGPDHADIVQRYPLLKSMLNRINGRDPAIHRPEIYSAERRAAVENYIALVDTMRKEPWTLNRDTAAVTASPVVQPC